MGLEAVTAAELARLGAGNIRPLAGGVHFEGSLEILYKANLWMRTASRIVRPLREFAAINPEMLYSQVRRVRWEDYLNPTRTLAVHAAIQGAGTRVKHAGQPAAEKPSAPAGPRADRGRRGNARNAPDERRDRPGINHSQYAALKIKDAIVDRLRREQGDRPNIDTVNPDIRVQAYFAGGRCTLSLDSTGFSLHERDYRLQTTGAPLKETLAAGIIELTGWDGRQPLLDPMCGSGTLLIEAALRARQIAPALRRQSFGFERWPDFDAELWERVRAEARAAVLDKCPAPLCGRDVDPQAIRAATANAQRAGVADSIRWEVAAAETARPPAGGPGMIVVNPPYGERLGADADLEQLYCRLGELWQQYYSGWSACVFAGNLKLARQIGLEATDKFRLHNGPLECRLLKFAIP